MDWEKILSRDVGTQASRAAIQPGFLSSQAEKRLFPRQVRIVFHVVGQKTRLDYDLRGLGFDIIALLGGSVSPLTPLSPSLLIT